jgi:DNA-binding NarL/FixJ family response regulator
MSDENFNLAGLYRILISENIPLIQKGLASAVNRESDMAVCGHSDNVLETLAAIERQMPDVLIIDIDVAGEEISETISRITARHPETRIIALSLRDNGQDRLLSMRAGAKGFIGRTSSTETVIEAIRKVLTGGTWFPELDTEQGVNIEAGIEEETIDVNGRLTKREIQIFEMIGSGTSAKEISNKLFISQRTVESHRDHIKNKLEFKDAFHLHQFAFEWVNDHKKVNV